MGSVAPATSSQCGSSEQLAHSGRALADQVTLDENDSRPGVAPQILRISKVARSVISLGQGPGDCATQVRPIAISANCSNSPSLSPEGACSERNASQMLRPLCGPFVEHYPSLGRWPVPAFAYEPSLTSSRDCAPLELEGRVANTGGCGGVRPEASRHKVQTANVASGSEAAGRAARFNVHPQPWD